MSSNGPASYYASAVAAGSLLMALIVVGLVLYVGQLVDQVEALNEAVEGHEATFDVLAEVIERQNRAIVELGGESIPVPVPMPHQAPPHGPPSRPTTTTTTTVPCTVEVTDQCR